MEKPGFMSCSPVRYLTGSAALILLATLLSSCAPAPAGAPSVALSEQLQQIRRQQQQQSEQLQLLSRQMVLLQEVMGIEEMKLDEQDPVEALIFSATPPTDLSGLPPQTVPQIELNPAVAAYLDAFSHLASGRPDSAERGFELFLREFPDHQHSTNARYWLAQAQSGQGKNDLATTTLRQIITDPRAQFKAPAALMQLAAIYRRQGLNNQADTIVEQLRASYPNSPEAQLLIRKEASQTDSDLNSRQRGN
ncbi:tetratricopeptide repeat protein [Pelovirga terrestris]|uniref:Tetratricopeptide repeat protein n=1 Tax=Pelovirga terrestris TaxID=2771352 RepID=A0A8J6QWC6_9BACT|nr:tetratricopeptide repeat protein [Pelovirga terrestris]MBD1399756.1 tetratricopeptide repeat protein [Pelovirga terrestris]